MPIICHARLKHPASTQGALLCTQPQVRPIEAIRYRTMYRTGLGAGRLVDVEHEAGLAAAVL